MNGKEQFVANLDQMFNESLGKSKFDFYSQLPDHTGNVGQFSMANERLCIFLIFIVMLVSLGKLRSVSASC